MRVMQVVTVRSWLAKLEELILFYFCFLYLKDFFVLLVQQDGNYTAIVRIPVFLAKIKGITV